MKSRTITCDLCGSRRAIRERITRTYGKRAKLLIIENVPVVKCRRCGEIYLTADTAHEIERIKLHRRSLARKRSIAVATFV